MVQVTLPRLLALLPAALLALGVPVPAGAETAATAKPALDRLTAVLTLAGRPGDTARLHALASHRAIPSRLKALAPATAHRDVALGFARAHHLQVVRADAWSVSLSGPSAVIAELFGGVVRHASTGTWSDRVAVPGLLSRDVASVAGLDNRPLHRRPVHTPRATIDGADNPQTGASLRAAYDVPTGWNGAGVTVGILDLAGWDPKDLSTYATREGLPVVAGQVTEIPVDGADPHALDGYGSEFEVALDSEAVLAAAPEAKQRLYFAPNTTGGIISAIQQMAKDAADGKLQAVSTSWGSCEKQFDTVESLADRAAYSAAIDHLVAAGATLFAASGDAAAFDCSSFDTPDNEAQVDFPASYVNTVAVGGTTLTPNQPEIAWYDSGFGRYLGDGSGGGESVEQPLPSYQSGNPTSDRRRVPDVASDADPQSGLQFYVASQGGWTVGGGTSLAAPTWAAMLADTLSSRAGAPLGLGNILPALYASAADQVSPGFADVTLGHNGLFEASSGYDQVTGLGVPRWSALGPDLLATSPGAPAPSVLSRVSRPTTSPDPVVTAPAYVRTRDVPLTVTVPTPSSYRGFSVGETLPGCLRQQATPPTAMVLDPYPYQGVHQLVLTAFDSSKTCHAVTRDVVYDTVPPTSTTVTAALVDSYSTRVRLTLGGRDAVSGLGSWRVVIRDLAGRTAYANEAALVQPVVSLRVGTSYRVEVTSRDRAGNLGPVVTQSFTVPTDDVSFVRSRGWVRAVRSLDFQGTHLGSTVPGASLTATVTARSVDLLLLYGPTSGFVAIYIDGRYTTSWDLYAVRPTNVRHHAAVWTTAGRHTVKLVVRGTRRAASHGTAVSLDGFTAAR